MPNYSFIQRLSALLIALAALASCATKPAPPPAVNTDPAKAQVVLPVPANSALPSLILIGDSTVRNGRDDGQGKGREGQWGWGNPIAAHFDQSKINVVNRAVGGLSSRTYQTSGHWERTLAFVKPGDVVIMQFGHNDSGAINDTSRARASIKGVGDEAQEIDNLLTLKKEVVHSYGWYLRKYIADIRARGATPIICSPIPRKAWDEAGRVRRAKGDFAGWAEQVAREQKVGFIDLNEMAAQKYDELGRDAVMTLFPVVTPDERVHTNMAGAELNAQLVLAGLKGLSGHPLKAFMKDERPVVDAARVKEQAPANPLLPSLFIVGDSTVKSGGQNGAFGWGERIAPYFDTDKINIVNHAIGGRSSRTFFTEGRWDRVLAQLKPGDVVLIQFGHNDGGRIGDPAMKNRASGAGIGPETIEDTRPDGSKEQVHTFGWYMAKYIADAAAKGARVILASPVPHKDKWENGRDFASFAQWNEDVAKAGGAQHMDLTMLVSDGYRQLGADKVNTFFSDARTHTNDAGARFNAEMVVAGLKRLQNNPLAPYLVQKSPCESWGQTGRLLYSDDFNGKLTGWVAEYARARGSSVATAGGKLAIDVAGGATVWFRQPMAGNVLITFKRKVIMQGGKNDRLSDLNQFWMARDPSGKSLFTRKGEFSEYDGLAMYYAGIGGNTNTTTRLRKYNGRGERVLLSDLTDSAHLLQANRDYAVQIAVYKGCTRVLMDGHEYFSYKDAEPLESGHFGFRTTQSRQEIDDFKVYRLD